MNATVWEITPTSPRDYDNIRYCVRDNVQAGDTVLLVEAGPYTEASSIELNKNVVIMAKEGVTPVVQLANGAYFKMMNDANTKIIGLKFDGATNSTQYGIRPYDASKSSIIIEDCEFYGFTKNIITCDGANHADSVIIDKCYFHDNTRAAVYFATSNDAGGSNCCDKVKVTNTTIANISALSGAGAIDIRNNENNVEGATSVLFVDHCTFYNILGYERIVHSLKSPLVTISNCVFSQPETATNYATWAYGGEVSNCIIYNLAGHHDWSPCPTFTSCSVADPKFKDAANGDYGFSEDSPALTAASDGGVIGDPRWVPAPAPAHTYTVAGSSAELFGEAWKPAKTENDMELQNDGTYKWEKSELTLAAGAIEFKVCEDHGWDKSWPSQNYVLNISEDGIYTITITFDPESKNVAAEATKTGSAEVDPTASIKGSWDGWAQEVVFTLAADKKSASGVVNITEATDYTFKVILNGGDWRSNGYTYHRDFTGAADITGNADNMILTADVAGEYTFTWTFETNALEITFPELAPVADEWVKIIFTEAVEANDLDEEATFTVLGSEFALKLHDAGNKMSIDANDCRFGTAEDYTMYNYRIKSGGASGSDKNYFTLNIPEAGILRIAPRTSSNGATDRALVIAQGDKELYNAVVQESQATEVQEGDKKVNVYPYVEVKVAAGEVSVRYTAGMNFYAFAFKAEGGETPVVLDAPDAAPADPTLEAYQVKAVYSAKYSADCSFGEWSSGTAYTQEEFGKKYVTTNSGYFGLEFAHKDCSEMEKLHLDAWIAADASIRVVPIHGGTEVGVTVELKGQKWNSIDIDLSKFEGVTDWSNVYQIKIDEAANLTFWLNNVYFYTTQTKTIDLVDGYYLIGTMNSWDLHNVTAADKFAVNPENDKEYVLTTALAENAEFKVVAVANNALGAWYPGEGENYKVDFAHAGENKDIYFRPDYQGGEGWHAGCIYVAENVNTNPYETWFATGDTWNAETESYLEWNEDAKKATVYIKVDKYGQWRAQVKYHGPIAEAGKYYRVALKMKSNNALQNVTIKYQDNAEMIYVADAALEAGVEFVFDKTAAGVAGGNGIMVLDFGFAKAGDVIEIYDVVIEETEAPEQVLADGYYLIGKIGGVEGWDVADVKAENKFEQNPENNAEYMLNVTLAEGDELQVVNVVNDQISGDWFPGGEGNNYIVDADHAGEVTIYFRPDREGGDDWWKGCIYVDAKDEPVADCDWDNLSWIGTADQTYANQFKICVGDPAPGVDVIQTPGWAREIGLYLTFPSAVWDLSKFSLTEDQYDIQGAGMIIHLSALQNKETEITIGCDNKEFVFTIYNDKGKDASAIESNTIAPKAVKLIENGQLYIILNGVRYNALGQME